jgi:hypothetical protein
MKALKADASGSRAALLTASAVFAATAVLLAATSASAEILLPAANYPTGSGPSSVAAPT